MIKIIKYNHSLKHLWDNFIANSKNGFKDFSLLFFEEKDNLIAVMPCNVREHVLISHGGLTFGGVVTDYRMRTSKMLEIFEIMQEYLRDRKITKIRYKAVPHIYHTIPAEEDMYALFINNACLVRREVSTSIYMNEKIDMSERRRRGAKKAFKKGIEVRRSTDYKTYMSIVKKILSEKYNIAPVHSSEEIEMLATKFPENIKLFSAYKGSEMMAGVVIYESKNVAHAQYLSSSEDGKKIGGLDLVLDFLINDVYSKKKYFDFGNSNENEGRYLNVGLITQKEEFGGRAVVYDTYEMEIR